MKLRTIIAITASLLTFASATKAAVSVSIKNFTSTSVGTPIVNAAGVPVASTTIFASAGIFTTLPDFSTATASQVLADFTAIDNTPVAGFASSQGVFTANDLSGGTYPAGFSGANAYVLVGNNSTLANSTVIAVYHLAGQVFTPVDGFGNATVAIAANATAGWVYGTVTPLSAQPTGIGTTTYTQGIQLISSPVPEPSAALLGMLGGLALLRRRR